MKFSHKTYEKLIDLVRERPALHNFYQKPDVAQEHVNLLGTHSKILYVFFFVQFQLPLKMIERAVFFSFNQNRMIPKSMFPLCHTKSLCICSY